MADLGTPGPLRDRRILVVEDDYLLAEDLRYELEAQGAEVVGPAPSVSRALALLSTDPPLDAAVLDMNLGGQMTFPVADALLGRGIRFVFVTGYNRSVLPDAYARVACLEKPLNLRLLLRALTEQG